MPNKRKKLGRSELARSAHFLKAGPTEKRGRALARARRQRDHLEERESRLRTESAPAIEG